MKMGGDAYSSGMRGGEKPREEADGFAKGAAAAGSGYDQNGQAPSIHVHSHAGGHTVHILHADGRHEAHEHARGDVQGISAHIQQHLK